MKIYVTLGTQKFPFDRLLKKIDYLCEKEIINSREMIVQCAYHDYNPKHFKIIELIDINKVVDIIQNSDLIITHAGTGSIVQAIKFKKRVIIVPRNKDYGEHIDNHQIEIANVLSEKGNATIVNEIDDLDYYIENLEKVNNIDYKLDNKDFLESILLNIKEIERELKC